MSTPEQVVLQPKYPYSLHIFLYPFKWLPSEAAEREANELQKRKPTDGDSPKEPIDLLCKALCSGKIGWEQKIYSFDNSPDNDVTGNFNEYTYFYDFVQSSLYDTKLNNDEPVRYLRLPTDSTATFTINTTKPDKDKKHIPIPFTLDVVSINMHLFSTEVGVLTFELANNRYPDSEDILLINQIGRRIYPQFLGSFNTEIQKAGITDNEREAFLKQGALHAPLQARFIAQSIILKTDKDSDEINEDFSIYKNPLSLWSEKHLEMPLPAYIKALFPKDQFEFRAQQQLSNKFSIQTIMDDRMFAMCWYGNDALASGMGGKTYADGRFPYERSEDVCKEGDFPSKFWYAFVLADVEGNSPTITHPRMMQNQIQEFTYERWAKHGTLYGVTRDTFMVLSSSTKTLLKYDVPRLDHHISRMYYQMVILCLVQRTSLLNFRNKLKILTSDVRTANNKESIDDNLVKKAGELYLNFIDFMNRIYFREVTPQIQGDEIYSLLQKQMGILPEVEALDREMSELNEHVATLQTRNISQVANYLIPLSLVTSILGFIGINNFYYGPDEWEFSWQFFINLTLFIAGTFASIMLYQPILKFVRMLARLLKKKSSSIN